MSNLALIFICLLLGLLLKRTGRFPANTHTALNAFVIFVSFPATVLLQITHLFSKTAPSWSLLLPASMGWLLFAGSWALIAWIGKRRKWSDARTGALILTAGLGNTSFVGFPLLEALLGSEAVPWGVLVDQLGSFFVLSTLGIVVASRYGRPRDGKPRSIPRQVFSFPPFLALLTALSLSAFGFVFTGISEILLARLASTLVPLALFAVGFQLNLSPSTLRSYGRPLSLGLLYKLFLAPAALMVLYVFVLGQRDFVTRVTLLEAAMATMITSAVVAADFSLDEELANLMVGVSVPLSLLTVPVWNYLLSVVL